MDIQSLSGVTASMSKAGLAEGSNPATIQTAAPNGAGVDYAIDGYAYHLADADNVASAAFDADEMGVVPVSSSCLLMVVATVAGALSFVQGNIELTSAVTDGERALQWPTPPVGTCPLGGVRVDTNASNTFTLGTTDFGGTGITDTWYDFIGGVPGKPIAT